MPFQSFRDLEVWQVGMELAERVYPVARSLPKDETFGLGAQLRRSAVSVPSNIAEGWGRDNPGDYSRFLRIANGSLKELETQLELAARLELANQEAIDPALQLADRLGRTLRSLIRTIDP
jgi:four helix bundle protein